MDMYKKSDKIVKLIGKYFRNVLAGKEATFFIKWLLEHEENQEFIILLSDPKSMDAEMMKKRDSATLGMWEKIQLLRKQVREN